MSSYGIPELNAILARLIDGWCHTNVIALAVQPAVFVAKGKSMQQTPLVYNQA
jgi:hypothetical protein